MKLSPQYTHSGCPAPRADQLDFEVGLREAVGDVVVDPQLTAGGKVTACVWC